MSAALGNASAGGLVLFGIGGGYWVSRKLLARIDALSDTTRTIMEGDLTGRLPVNGSGDELDRLSESLNLMLARIACHPMRSSDCQFVAHGRVRKRQSSRP